MDEADDFGSLYADLDETVDAGFTTVNSSSESIVKESKPNDCELNNRSDSLVDYADAALDLGDGVQSDGYTSESEDDLCIVLNENEHFDLRIREIGEKEEDFRVGNRLAQHERCEPVGFWGKSSMLRYGQGDWNLRIPYFSGLRDAIPNGFNFFLPRNWTIFDVNIEELDYKPWRQEGVNLSDYFNFDLDEDSWKSYCRDMDLLRNKAMVLNCVKRGRAEDENDKKPEQPKGRAILVRSHFGERVPSTDIWRPPTERDSDVVIHINVTGSMEDENNLDATEVKNPEVEEGELESTLMEHENEPTERCFDPQQDDTDYGLDTNSMMNSYYERGRRTQVATGDLDSPSEESIEERNFNKAYRSSKRKAEFQSTWYSSSRTGFYKKSEVLKPGKDRDGKNKNSMEESPDRYTSVSDRYRSSWGTKKHRSLRYHPRSFSIKGEQRDRLFARKVAVPSAHWHGKGDKPPFGTQKYWYMGVQNPRNPRPEMRVRYGHNTTGNIKYNNGGYTGHLRSERHHYNQTILHKGNVQSQRGHYRQDFVCGHSYTEDEYVLGTFEERRNERRYNWPPNRRFNNFQTGFVKRGSWCGGISREVTANRPFVNGRRWYGNDWFIEGKNKMGAFVDTRETSYIADDYGERGRELLGLRCKETFNIHFGDERKKLPRKDYEISCEDRSQHIKRSTNYTSDSKDRILKISRYERRNPYQAGSANTIPRADGANDSEQVLLSDKIGEEKRFNERILEAIDKMQKRRERFKESAFLKKEGEKSEKKPLLEVEAHPVADESKNPRPVRKRRWGCQ